MPCNYSDYPANWKDLVARKKLRHNNKCELCYAPNGQIVERFDSVGNSYPWEQADPNDGDDDRKLTKIILTVHHIDSDHQNNHPDNLLLCCQRCHLRLDIQKHRKGARETRARKKGLTSFL